MGRQTMFCKLKNGDRFTYSGIPGIYTKTGEREAWSPNGRLLLYPESIVNFKKGVVQG